MEQGDAVVAGSSHWRSHDAHEKRVGARGERFVVGRGAARAARRPSPSPTRRREWEARHYRARATSCGVPSYLLRLAVLKSMRYFRREV